jgi:hypothetical protein
MYSSIFSEAVPREEKAKDAKKAPAKRLYTGQLHARSNFTPKLHQAFSYSPRAK